MNTIPTMRPVELEELEEIEGGRLADDRLFRLVGTGVGNPGLFPVGSFGF